MKIKKAQASKQQGFTLIELLVVIAIIVILASLIMGGMKYATHKQNTEKCKAQLAMLETALEAYKLENGSYPIADDDNSSRPGDQNKGANVLFRALYWDSDNDGTSIKSDPDQKAYLPELDPYSAKQGWASSTGDSANDQNVINDPWGNRYQYRSGTDASGNVNNNCINPDFDLWSMGPDGKGGTTFDKDNIKQ